MVQRLHLILDLLHSLLYQCYLLIVMAPIYQGPIWQWLLEPVLYQWYLELQRAQQDLSALNIVVKQRQRAFASLVDLQNKGISDTELIELNKLINSWEGWSQEQNNYGVNTVNRLARLDDKLHTPIN
jgi:hypothetical protein